VSIADASGNQTARPLMSLERRRFIAAIAGSVLAAPLAAGAQQAGKVYRIGVLANEPSPMWEAFRAAAEGTRLR